MLAADTLFDIPVTTCGVLARPLFAGGLGGRVTAVFERSFYIEAAGTCACVVGAAAGAGPLNLVIEAPRPIDWIASGLGVGADVRQARGGVVVANRFRLDLTAARTWQPPAPARGWNEATLRAGLAALRTIARARGPMDGLARLDRAAGRCDVSDLVAAAASPVIAALEATLAPTPGAAAADFSCARRLLGLGPGLTPSGDDFLGGVMIALHASGRSEIGAALWQTLAPAAATRTHAIARAHLAGAAQGMGAAAVHDVLNATLEGRGDDLGDLCHALDRLGHTSGWDIIAGARCTLEAVAQTSRLMSPARLHRETPAAPD